jgi:hypothetical protein
MSEPESHDASTPAEGQFRQQPSGDPSQPGITGQHAYNLTTDLATGLNVRVWDNLIQAASIAICFCLGILIGCLVTSDRITGGVLGAFVGLLVGLFGSGVFLMVFRALRHLRGKHD